MTSADSGAAACSAGPPDVREQCTMRAARKLFESIGSSMQWTRSPTPCRKLANGPHRSRQVAVRGEVEPRPLTPVQASRATSDGRCSADPPVREAGNGAPLVISAPAETRGPPDACIASWPICRRDALAMYMPLHAVRDCLRTEESEERMQGGNVYGDIPCGRHCVG